MPARTNATVVKLSDLIPAQDVKIDLTVRKSTKAGAKKRAEEIKALSGAGSAITGVYGLKVAESLLAKDYETATWPKDTSFGKKIEAYYKNILDPSVKLTAAARKEVIPPVFSAALSAFGERADTPDDTQPKSRLILTLVTGVTQMQVYRDLVELELIKPKPESTRNGHKVRISKDKDGNWTISGISTSDPAFAYELAELLKQHGELEKLPPALEAANK